MTDTELTYSDAFATAMWLESTARPQLRKWVKSGDARLRVSALVLSGIIEQHATAGDAVALYGIRQAWDGCTAAPEREENPA